MSDNTVDDHRLHPSKDDSWLSAHLFANCSTIYSLEGDEVILRVVKPFVEVAQKAAWISGYFFIRYSEGGPHIRLRLRGRAELLHDVVRPALVEWIDEVAAHFPYPLSLRWIPYEQEVGRYGGMHAVRVAEYVFGVTSDVSLALLADPPVRRASHRLGRAVLAMACQLRAFLSDPGTIRRFANQYSLGYLRSMHPDPQRLAAAQAALDARCLPQVPKVSGFLVQVLEGASGVDAAPWMQQLYSDLKVARAELENLFARGEIALRANADWLSCMGLLLPSYLHMTNNRLGVRIDEEAYLGRLLHLGLSSGTHDYS